MHTTEYCRGCSFVWRYTITAGEGNHKNFGFYLHMALDLFVLHTKDLFSFQHLENLPYYWRHGPQPSPSSPGESEAGLPSNPQHQIKDQKKIDNVNIQIEKNHVLPAIRNLLRFVQRLTDESNFARLLLTCKV